MTAPTSLKWSDTGCGCPTDPPPSDANNITYRNFCPFWRNVSESAIKINLNQNIMAYGASCTYLLVTDCGYTDLTFKGTNLDILVGYN